MARWVEGCACVRVLHVGDVVATTHEDIPAHAHTHTRTLHPSAAPLLHTHKYVDTRTARCYSAAQTQSTHLQEIVERVWVAKAELRNIGNLTLPRRLPSAPARSSLLGSTHRKFVFEVAPPWLAEFGWW